MAILMAKNFDLIDLLAVSVYRLVPRVFALKFSCHLMSISHDHFLIKLTLSNLQSHSITNSAKTRIKKCWVDHFCQHVGGTKISILREIKAKRFSWRLEVCFNINFKKVTWNIICKHLQPWHLRSEPEKEPVLKCGHNHYIILPTVHYLLLLKI